jgi:hypothetical protein
VHFALCVQQESIDRDIEDVEKMVREIAEHMAQDDMKVVRDVQRQVVAEVAQQLGIDDITQCTIH